MRQNIDSNPKKQVEKLRSLTRVIFGKPQIVAKLGLTYGAIDAIEQPNGAVIFLEVNPLLM